MTLRFFCRALLISLILLGTLEASAQGPHRSPEPARSNQAGTPYRGGLVSPPLPKPRFTLTDTSGTPFDFWSGTQGSVALLFFGYTHCPDMCPLQMYMIADALKKIPADSANQFKVVFVTTDPDRDNPQVLRKFLDRYDKKFIGLTGTQAAIDAAQIAANLAPAKNRRCAPTALTKWVTPLLFWPTPRTTWRT